MKHGAIFDMDGLLFDTERLYRDGWVEMAKRFGQVHREDFPAAVAGTSGEGMRTVIRRFYPQVDATAFQEGCYAYVQQVVTEQGPPVKPGAREILAFFRERGVKTAVASSSSLEMIQGNLRAAGMEDLFDTIVSGGEVKRGKPEPDIFLLAAERIGCAPGDCCVFEDGLNGVRAGIAAGCATVMIPDLFQPDETLQRDCAGIYGSLTEARDAIAAGAL